jgi:hypothetical protein
MPNTHHLRNFGRNLTLTPKRFYTPKSEHEVLEIMDRHAGAVIRCIGRMHSWSNILDCEDVTFDLKHLRTVKTGTDDAGHYAEVGAGCQIKHLVKELNVSQQWTLPSLGFITEQTIAGAISTGTHGSGKHSLSHYVQAVRIAHYDADSGRAVITEVKSGDELRAARCSLGTLGVILTVKIEVRDQYRVEEQFRKYSDINDVLAAETEFPLQQFYLVPWKWSFYAQQRRETMKPPSLLAWLYHQYRFWVFDVFMHLLIFSLTRTYFSKLCTQLAYRWIIPACVIRNWKVVADSSTQLVMEHELFHHIELELFVQRPELPDALDYLTEALKTMASTSMASTSARGDRPPVSRASPAFAHLQGSYCHHYPICIRKVQCDDTLISMSCQSDSRTKAMEPWYSITLTNLHRGKQRTPFMEMMPILTNELSVRFGARTHWGKLFGMSGHQVGSLYPALQRFLTIRAHFDPTERFLNDWARDCFSNNNDLPKPTSLTKI